MTDIAVALPPDPRPIADALRAIFPDHIIAVEEDWMALPAGLDLGVVIHPNASEFPCGLAISAQMRPGHDFEAWLRGLSRALSLHLKTRCICDAGPIGGSSSPYWSLIWDEGRPWLGYDFESTLSDGAGGPVERRGPLTIRDGAVPDADALRRWLERAVDQ